jgi:hypothetical protein
MAAVAPRRLSPPFTGLFRRSTVARRTSLAIAATCRDRIASASSSLAFSNLTSPLDRDRSAQSARPRQRSLHEGAKRRMGQSRVLKRASVAPRSKLADAVELGSDPLDQSSINEVGETGTTPPALAPLAGKRCFRLRESAHSKFAHAGLSRRKLQLGRLIAKIS